MLKVLKRERNFGFSKSELLSGKLYFLMIEVFLERSKVCRLFVNESAEKGSCSYDLMSLNYT